MEVCNELISPGTQARKSKGFGAANSEPFWILHETLISMRILLFLPQSVNTDMRTGGLFYFPLENLIASRGRRAPVQLGEAQPAHRHHVVVMDARAQQT